MGLMRLYALRESKAEALAQYERLEEVLSKELGTEPATSSRALREEIALGRFPPKETYLFSPEEQPGAAKHNLPAPRTSFVGREREMLEVKRALAMTRLLTLTGTGGCGKTRLAIEVARDLVGAYPDGAWLIELAPLADSALLPQAVAEALAVPKKLGRPLTDALVETLHAKEMLLVLDNCEHLVEDAARLVDILLDACPKLRILSTSREVLDVAGERSWLVQSLSVPGEDRQSTVGEVARCESVRLFVERARLKVPDFELIPENMKAVAQICRKMDGVPLAIELAAARIGTLAVEQISERLEDSLKLLTSGGRTGVPRHRTLRGALDWSHELLSESEKKLFRRLSAFMGGWTLEGAEAVVSGGGVEEDDVLDVLSGLVDKSLVVAETTGKGRVRYRLLEPVRQYALQKQEASGEGEKVRRRHAEFFLALAQETEQEMKGPGQEAWLRRLEAEHDNLRAALSWTLGSGEAELALRLAEAFWWFWESQGHFDEGRRWLEQALAKDTTMQPATRAKALDGVGWLALDLGDVDRAVAAAEEGLELGVEAEIELSVAASLLRILGDVAVMQGDYVRATELFEESLALGREAADNLSIAWSLLDMGFVASDRGDHKRATEFYEEGLALCRESGYVILLPYYLSNLGYEFLLQGNHEQAAALNEEVAVLVRNNRQGGRLWGPIKGPLDRLGWATLLQGDNEQATTWFEENLRLSRELGSRLIATESLGGLACATGAKGETERAARLFGAAEALREAVGYQQPPREVALRESYLAAARSQLKETVWDAAFAEGRAMELEEAVEYALSEEVAAPPSLRTASQEPPHILTRREREVAGLVARGLTNRQIASELMISGYTVNNHVANILKKLDLHSREQVADRLTEQ